MTDLISVIIPVYKVEKCLDRCVESLVNQTYQNLEIILIDDGGNDNCPQMCDEWAKKDDRIKVVHKENGGVSSARNVGLDIAKGVYIGFVDSDDYIDSTMYEKLYNAIIEQKADIARCGYNEFYDNGVITPIIECELPMVNSNNLLEMYIKNGEYKHCKNCIKTRTIAPNIWTFLYKKDVIGNIRFGNLKIGEDFVFNCAVVNNSVKMTIVNENLYYYFIHNQSVMHVMTEKNITARLDFAEHAINILKNRVAEDSLKSYKFSLFKGIIMAIVSTNDSKMYTKFKTKINSCVNKLKDCYKVYSKSTKGLKNKILDWLIYRRKIKTLKFLYRLKHR